MEKNIIINHIDNRYVFYIDEIMNYIRYENDYVDVNEILKTQLFLNNVKEYILENKYC